MICGLRKCEIESEARRRLSRSRSSAFGMDRERGLRRPGSGGISSTTWTPRSRAAVSDSLVSCWRASPVSAGLEVGLAEGRGQRVISSGGNSRPVEAKSNGHLHSIPSFLSSTAALIQARAPYNGRRERRFFVAYEMVKVASQTQKRNNREQTAPINPDNNTQATNKGRTGSLWGWDWPVMEWPDVNLLVRSGWISQIYYAKGVNRICRWGVYTILIRACLQPRQTSVSLRVMESSWKEWRAAITHLDDLADLRPIAI